MYSRSDRRGARGGRTGMPALPFCKTTLRAGKPKPSGYPNSLRTLGDRLRAQRMDLGIPQRDLAAQLGVDVDSIRNWEKNRSGPAIQFLPRIFSFLDSRPTPGDASLGARLLHCREIHGLSQRELAKSLGVDVGTLCRWETGKSRPGQVHVKRIENVLKQ